MDRIVYFLAAFPPSLYNGLNTTDSNHGLKITNIGDIAIIISNLIEILVSLAGALAVIFIVWGGIQYAVSQGDSGATKEAKGTITNSIIGLLLATGAYMIVDFLARHFG